MLDADPAVVGYDADLDSRGFGVRTLKGDWEAVTGTAGVEYRPWDDTLIFAKYSRGYKAGGFNNLGFALNPYTDAEFVDSYEGRLEADLGWSQPDNQRGGVPLQVHGCSGSARCRHDEPDDACSRRPRPSS